MPKISDLFNNNNWSPQTKSRVFSVLRWFVTAVGVLVVISILSPTALSIILNVLRIVSIGVVGTFFVLGILVIIGLRKEATRILDVLLERSLTLIDFIEFLKLVYKRFIEILKEFLLYVTPILSYITAAIIYVLLLILYKTVGKSYDVTLFTIIITIVLVATVALLNRRREEIVDEQSLPYRKRVSALYKRHFIDSFEIVLFAFFLTIDSTRLFFLPENLNVRILSKFDGYNLMLRGFTREHLNWTINIVTVAIVCEVIRYSMRITALAKKYYASILEPRRIIRIKIAVRMAFANAKDDIVRFITFTTVLFSVFLIFPRLKLLSLAITSITNLIIDLFLPERLVIVKGTDLINRVINKIFRL